MAEAEILKLNKQAMEKLRSEDMTGALELLNEAQEILKEISTESQVWGVTFNNLGCYFKKIREFSTALSHFNKAMEIELKRHGDAVSLGGTYLNISYIYSEINLHEKALNFALKSLNLFSSLLEKDKNTWTSLVVSYHCAATEFEFLNRKQEAINSYQNGYEISKEKLGKSHKLSISLKRSLKKCQNLKSTMVFSVRNKKNNTLQSRSHSSNPHNRLKFPKVTRRIITPTKGLYANIKTIEIAPQAVILPMQQVNALSTLVKEIEKTFEQKPRKYVFRRKNGFESDYSNPESTNLPDVDQFPTIRRNNFGNCSEILPQNRLQIIPESNHEDSLDQTKKITRKK